MAGWLNGVFDADGLVAAVDLSTDERLRMAAYRPRWAVFWLAVLLPGMGGFRRNPPGTTKIQTRHVMALVH